ncbi:uncharacterized protein LOC143298347 isoform X2 [Babylonia areolata]|uniref:uncharacterized protein LOC143298347 isoform X2 n=1 Tax=Babylonia areolata TaxID=304850 RepID=UPI003FD2FA75
MLSLGYERRTFVCLQAVVKRKESVMQDQSQQEQGARGRGRGRRKERPSSRPGAMGDVGDPEEAKRSPRLTGRGRARSKRPEQQLFVPKALRSKENHSGSSKGTKQDRKHKNTDNRVVEGTGDSLATGSSETVGTTARTATETLCSEVTGLSVKEDTKDFQEVSMAESLCSEKSEQLIKENSVSDSEPSEVVEGSEENSEATEALHDGVAVLTEETIEIGAEGSAVVVEPEDSIDKTGTVLVSTDATDSLRNEMTEQHRDKTATEQVYTEMTEQPQDETTTESFALGDSQSRSVNLGTSSMETGDEKSSDLISEAHVAGDSVSVSVCGESIVSVRESGVSEDMTAHTEESCEKSAEAAGASGGGEEEEDNEDSWDKTFDDSGDCLNASAEEQKASKQSSLKAEHCQEDKPRPQTSVVVARRMVAGALGLKSSALKEKRDKGQKELKGAHGDMTAHRGESSEKSAEAAGGEEEEEEDSWDKMFDDNGDCLAAATMEELTSYVGEVEVTKIPKPINYLDYMVKGPDLDVSAYGHVIEISDFPASFQTADLLTAFKEFMNRGFDIKWVDDTHALGVFSSAIAANDALKMIHPMMKVKPLSEASKQSRLKAKRSQEFLQPFKPRPQTSAVAARRLVAGALGLKSNVPKEKRDEERKALKEAREKKRKDRKTKEDIWDGKVGSCAMDQ